MAPRIHSPAPAPGGAGRPNRAHRADGLRHLLGEPTAWWPLCVVIGGFTIVAEFTAVSAGPLLKVSCSFLGLVVAAAVLGPGPAAALGAALIVASWARHREPLHYFVNNLLSYIAFPLAAGIFFHEVTRAAHLGPNHAGYYLVVFATFVVALALNFFLCAGYMCWLDGVSLGHRIRESLIPLLSAELFSALLTVAAAYLTHRWRHRLRPLRACDGDLPVPDRRVAEIKEPQREAPANRDH